MRFKRLKICYADIQEKQTTFSARAGRNRGEYVQQASEVEP